MNMLHVRPVSALALQFHRLVVECTAYVARRIVRANQCEHYLDIARSSDVVNLAARDCLIGRGGIRIGGTIALMELNEANDEDSQLRWHGVCHVEGRRVVKICQFCL